MSDVKHHVNAKTSIAYL